MGVGPTAGACGGGEGAISGFRGGQLREGLAGLAVPVSTDYGDGDLEDLDQSCTLSDMGLFRKGRARLDPWALERRTGQPAGRRSASG